MATTTANWSGLYDIEGAAEYLTTTPRHIKRLWAERKLPAVKLGGKVRFKQSDLDLFIARNRVGS